MLKGAIERYQSARKAATYWKAQFQEDKEATKQKIRQHLDIPSEIGSFKLRFTQDSCALFMTGDDVNAYYRHINERRGTVTIQDVSGFVNKNLYLEDTSGNQCGVMVVDGDDADSKLIFHHEQQHIVYGHYYLRNSYEEVKEQPQNVRDAVRKFIEGKVTKDATSEEVSSVIRKTLTQILFDCRVLFYNEVLAEATEPFRPQNGKDYIREELASDIDPTYYPSGTPTFRHIYAHSLRQGLDGMIDFIQQADLPKDDKLRLWWNIESSAARFAKENRLIGDWIGALWELSGNRYNIFVSKLEAIPITRIWNIGIFLRQNPKDLREKFKSLEVLEHQIFWHMIVRIMQEDKKNMLDETTRQALIDEYMIKISQLGLVRDPKSTSILDFARTMFK